jgi:SagB-type dehydrogenase family enzyme
MKDISVQPILIAGYFENEKGELVFNTRNKQEHFENYQSEIKNLLQYCNGYLSIEQICKKIKSIESEVNYELCEYLIEKNILQDSRELYLTFHQDSSNTPRFYNTNYLPALKKTAKNKSKPLSVTSKLLSNRKTTRDFSNKVLSLFEIEEITQILNINNNVEPVPHAGGINGFTFYVCIHSNRKNLNKGIYKLSSITGKLIYHSKLDTGLLSTLLDIETNLLYSGITIFVTCDFTLQANKYGNRAYRYAMIETGHFAQNLQLVCAEKDLAIIENGGFLDQGCADLLGINYPQESVLLTLIIGHKSTTIGVDEELGKTQQLITQLKDTYVGKAKLLKYYNTQLLTNLDNSYYFSKMTFDGEYSHPSDETLNDYISGLSFATAQSHNMAFIKGCAETVERYYSSQLKIDLVCSASELKDNWLHPYTITPWHESMFENKCFEHFDETKKYEWIQGMNLKSNETVYALAENVYYPLYKSKEINRLLVTECTSSGVCAHPNFDLAIEGALNELIERDALISYNHLSTNIKLRILGLQKLGYQSLFLDIRVNEMPVILCLLINSSSIPALTTGASAIPSINVAIEKALDEAEFQLHSWNNDNKTNITFENVRSPADHARLYANPSMLTQIQWLIISEENFQIQVSKKEYNPNIFILKEPTFEGDFWVVRVIEETLFPINFGYGYEHYNHSRLKELSLEWKHNYPSTPHFFA